MLKKLLGTEKNSALTVLRVTLGVVMFAHGAQKMFGWFGGKGLDAAPTGADMRALPCSAESQFPTRTPSRFAPLTLRIPAARSGLRSPQSDAS